MNLRREYHQRWYAENKDRLLKQSRKLYADYRNDFLDMYGRACACCGETHIEFLTIEHLQGQRGTKRRVGNKAYRDATKEYRPDLYETLCMNCNHAKGRYGYCPHQKEKYTSYIPIRVQSEDDGTASWWKNKFVEGQIK